MDAFQVLTITPPGSPSPSLAIAGCRAGAIGVLDLEFVHDQDIAREGLSRLAHYTKNDFGIKSNSLATDFLQEITSGCPEHLKIVILTQPGEQLASVVKTLQGRGLQVFLECISLEEAQRAEQAGVDGVIVKGHEAGGRVGQETTFILLQRVLVQLAIPVYAQGGIGLHTAAACYAAGAAGIVLDNQLLLTRESPLAEAVKARIRAMDGSETVCLGEVLGEPFRVCGRLGFGVVKKLEETEKTLAREYPVFSERISAWRQTLARYVGWDSLEHHLLVFGQDIGLAAPLASRFETVGGIIKAMRQEVVSHCRAAQTNRILSESSPLAESHRTRYPIVQGPMARVSDNADFVAEVARQGALPFAAAAWMSGPELESLLQKTQALLPEQAWGIGLLGFLPPQQYQEQIEVILRYRPPFALIAGGQPHQAKALEQEGIATYLHVPSPGLLRMFLNQGVRRFVFEGRESGGHVGPLCSFVLWESMIDVLLQSPAACQLRDFHILFAGGIHDALSAAMVAAMAAPLAERGARVGLQLGSAYLFTDEAVKTGAIVSPYQQEALRCQQTTVLVTSPGHAERCIDTPFIRAFLQEKQALLKSGASLEEMRQTLDRLKLGRLRIATKGLARNPEAVTEPSAPKFIALSQAEQQESGIYLVGQLAALRHQTCTISSLHEDIVVGGSARLDGLVREDYQFSQASHELERPLDIAVIGMACLLPKASTLGNFWENLLNKVSAIREIPEDRWQWKSYYDEDRRARDKIYSKWGAFIDDTPFDPTKYGMPPSSLPAIEPLQLLALEVTSWALKDAGYSKRPFARERTSVIFGISGTGDLGQLYNFRTSLPLFFTQSSPVLSHFGGVLPEWTEDSFPGILMNVAAGRIANRLDLRGTNCIVDAACASSLAAIYWATKELESRTSDMVVVGGADCMQSPFTYMCFSKTQALSPRGRCQALDEKADGIVVGEGLVVFILKRLADAEQDGDRIYAVIKGVGASSDGRDKSLTAPRREGQITSLQRAYAKAQISPATVQLVEAHATGTTVGDRIEIEALSEVFQQAGAGEKRCAIGSIKSLLGHTKSAAGLTSLLKTTLALYHKVLPPTIDVEQPNQGLRLPGSPFYPNLETRPWINDLENPRRAGVSAFGFGGTNYHVVLEEYTNCCLENQLEPSFREWPGELLFWEKGSRQEIKEAIQALEERLAQGGKDVSLGDLAFTLARNSHRQPSKGIQNPCRLAIVASSVEDLRSKLKRIGEGLASNIGEISEPTGIYYTEQPLASSGKLAFLFPGQGSQYLNMLADLAVQFPEVHAQFERSNRLLEGKLSGSLNSFIFPPPAFSEEEHQAVLKALADTQVAQPAIGTADLALFKLLQSAGINPDMVAGHSYGEYVALCAGGIIGEDDLITLSEARARFILEGTGSDPGTMAAVKADLAAVEATLQGLEGVWIANINSPQQVVITGTQGGMEQALARLRHQGVQARSIPVSCAFHSPLVEPACHKLRDFLASCRVNEPRLQVYSNVTARPYPLDPEAIVTQLVRHLVSRVEFVKQIEAMYEDGARIFVEAGPGRVLSGLVAQILKDRPHVAITSNQAGRSGLLQLQHLLGQLMIHGVSADRERFFQGRFFQEVDLDKLGRDDPESQFSPSTWLINGSRAKPWKEVRLSGVKHFPPPMEITGSATPDITANALAAPCRVGAGEISPIPASRETRSGISGCREQPQHQPGCGASPPQQVFSGNDATQVMVQYQNLMQRFLKTQKTVMTSYLRSSGKMEAPPAGVKVETSKVMYISPAPEALPLAAEPQTALAKQPARRQDALPPAPEQGPPVGAPSPLSSSGEPSVQAPASLEDLTKQLLVIVGERTGYPLEMLNLNLDLEADLGIDSIKRTEILGHFLQHLTSLGVEEAQVNTEDLSRAKTLQEILAQVKTCLDLEVNGGAPQAGAKADISKVIYQSPPPEAAPLAAEAPAAFGGQTSASVHPTPPPGGAAGLASYSREDLTDLLLNIVSERTGYPVENLDLNLDLEADLGIDSIKRTEILGTFVQTFFTAQGGGPPEEFTDLSSIKTLAGIIERVKAYGSESRPGPSPLPVSPVSEVPCASAVCPTRQEVLPRFILTAHPTPLPNRTLRLAAGRVVLITDDGQGVAAALREKLNERGLRTAFLSLGDGDDPADLSPARLAELLKTIRDEQGPIGALVHLSPVRVWSPVDKLELHGWQRRLHEDVIFLFRLLQGAALDLKEAAAAGGAWVVSASGLGGSFACDPQHTPDFFPGGGGAVGLLKTAAMELPEVKVKCVDLDLEEGPAAMAEHLLTEIEADDDMVEVGYHKGCRLTLGLQETSLLSYEENTLHLDKSSVILVTGGARGITATVSLELARKYQPTLILAGRTPLPAEPEAPETADLTELQALKTALAEKQRRQGKPVKLPEVEAAYRKLLKEREMRANLAALREAGAQVDYVQVDVQDAAAFGDLLDQAYSRYGRLDGVIHGAGVIEDKLLQDKSWDSFDRVFKTKTDSAFVLSKKLNPEDLKFLVFFSSVAGRFGNRGQADYTAANEVYNKLAVYLDRKWPGRVLTINWGPWKGPGMVSAEVQRQFEQRGVPLVEPQAGARTFDLELHRGRKGEGEVLIGEGPWRQLASPSLPAKDAVPPLPLLHRLTTWRKTNGTLEIVRRLDPDHDLYLRDHRLDAKPVLPAAMAIEFMAEAAQQNFPGWQVAGLKSVRVCKGIVLDNAHQDIRILVGIPGSPNQEAATMELEVVIKGTASSEPVFYRGTVVMGQTSLHPEPYRLPPISEFQDFGLSAAEAYRRLTFHGPLFQNIQSIRGISEKGILTTIIPSEPQSCLADSLPGQWLIDPVVLDCGLQLGLFWQRTYFDITPLPSNFSEIWIYQPLYAGGPLECFYEVLREFGRTTVTANIYFLDQDSQLRLLIKGFESTGSKALNRLAGSHLLKEGQAPDEGIGIDG
jgi:acyl transferase domain-containing protein/NAD(P)H-dependent flavin oxidoreductase YrpB (nitropropane dioxygenase family)/NAD(P)-dependent dehydrogenase (short-subunit alcohol dehydrogenase family)/acyl carrier protein